MTMIGKVVGLRMLSRNLALDSQKETDSDPVADPVVYASIIYNGFDDLECTFCKHMEIIK